MRNNTKRLLLSVFFFSFLAGAAFVFSCSDDSTSPETGKGEFQLTMIDNPASYDEVNIVVTSVEVHSNQLDSTSGWFTINNIPGTYDLLTLRNGASAVLGNNELEAGQYSQIRLIIGTGSNVVVDGITHPLDIPSGAQSGLKLNHAFQIQPGLLYELILDFDAERSIVLTGNNQYKLKPVIRLVPTVISGTISGIVNPIFAAGVIYAINGPDTVSTVANPVTGYFQLMALLQKTYRVEILSADAAYHDTTIPNVTVTAEQNNDLGTITLSGK